MTGGAAGKVEVHPAWISGSNEPVVLPPEEPVKITVEPGAVGPDQIELPVVGGDDLVQQHALHTASLCRTDHRPLGKHPLLPRFAHA